MPSRYTPCLALLAATMAAAQPQPNAFHVCGNYCGPGYCNGKYLDETKCDGSVKPEVSHGNTSCADACCHMHDHCCGHEPPFKTCNKRIVDCLAKCSHLDTSCHLHGIPVPAGGVEVAMDIVEDWCCGSPCPKE